MSATPTEPAHDPTFREIDMSAEAIRVWGVSWNAPVTEYEFADGKRKFVRQSEDVYKDFG